jgi:mono/diheme cytochrome c family protein
MSLEFAWVRPAATVIAGLLISACQPSSGVDDGSPHLAGGSDVQRGRYMVTIGGCNDCHTDGYMDRAGDVPEQQWLMGSAIGWRGPWGTTYPRNLRISVQNYTEDEWVALLQTRKELPPMPWMNINHIAEPDARALYRYITSLGPAGETMPDPLPPEVEPTTPYLSMFPVMPGG